jgi:hypothetical protein
LGLPFMLNIPMFQYGNRSALPATFAEQADYQQRLAP